eukprot:Clim_evm8s228 gene=Clim_evmTU8s228
MAGISIPRGVACAVLGWMASSGAFAQNPCADAGFATNVDCQKAGYEYSLGAAAEPCDACTAEDCCENWTTCEDLNITTDADCQEEGFAYTVVDNSDTEYTCGDRDCLVSDCCTNRLACGDIGAATDGECRSLGYDYSVADGEQDFTCGNNDCSIPRCCEFYATCADAGFGTDAGCILAGFDFFSGNNCEGDGDCRQAAKCCGRTVTCADVGAGNDAQCQQNGFDFKRPGPVACESGDNCTPELCCSSYKTCVDLGAASDAQCNVLGHEFYIGPANPRNACDGAACIETDCCSSFRSCAEVDLASDTACRALNFDFAVANAASKTCQGRDCRAEDCCQAYRTCADIDLTTDAECQAISISPKKYYDFATGRLTGCEGSDCTVADCCGVFESCETLGLTSDAKCSQLGFDRVNDRCGGGTNCRPRDCCQANASCADLAAATNAGCQDLGFDYSVLAVEGVGAVNCGKGTREDCTVKDHCCADYITCNDLDLTTDAQCRARDYDFAVMAMKSDGTDVDTPAIDPDTGVCTGGDCTEEKCCGNFDTCESLGLVNDRSCVDLGYNYVLVGDDVKDCGGNCSVATCCGLYPTCGDDAAGLTAQACLEAGFGDFIDGAQSCDEFDCSLAECCSSHASCNDIGLVDDAACVEEGFDVYSVEAGILRGLYYLNNPEAGLQMRDATPGDCCAGFQTCETAGFFSDATCRTAGYARVKAAEERGCGDSTICEPASCCEALRTCADVGLIDDRQCQAAGFDLVREQPECHLDRDCGLNDCCARASECTDAGYLDNADCRAAGLDFVRMDVMDLCEGGPCTAEQCCGRYARCSTSRYGTPAKCQAAGYDFYRGARGANATTDNDSEEFLVVEDGTGRDGEGTDIVCGSEKCNATECCGRYRSCEEVNASTDAQCQAIGFAGGRASELRCGGVDDSSTVDDQDCFPSLCCVFSEQFANPIENCRRSGFSNDDDCNAALWEALDVLNARCDSFDCSAQQCCVGGGPEDGVPVDRDSNSEFGINDNRFAKYQEGYSFADDSVVTVARVLILLVAVGRLIVPLAATKAGTWGVFLFHAGFMAVLKWQLWVLELLLATLFFFIGVQVASGTVSSTTSALVTTGIFQLSLLVFGGLSAVLGVILMRALKWELSVVDHDDEMNLAQTPPPLSSSYHALESPALTPVPEVHSTTATGKTGRSLSTNGGVTSLTQTTVPRGAQAPKPLSRHTSNIDTPGTLREDKPLYRRRSLVINMDPTYTEVDTVQQRHSTQRIMDITDFARELRELRDLEVGRTLNRNTSSMSRTPQLATPAWSEAVVTPRSKTDESGAGADAEQEPIYSEPTSGMSETDDIYMLPSELRTTAPEPSHHEVDSTESSSSTMSYAEADSVPVSPLSIPPACASSTSATMVKPDAMLRRKSSLWRGKPRYARRQARWTQVTGEMMVVIAAVWLVTIVFAVVLTVAMSPTAVVNDTVYIHDHTYIIIGMMVPLLLALGVLVGLWFVCWRLLSRLDNNVDYEQQRLHIVHKLSLDLHNLACLAVILLFWISVVLHLLLDVGPLVLAMACLALLSCGALTFWFFRIPDA